MTTGVSTAATANENGLKLTIVNPQNLYDPSPNGYSTAVITTRQARVAYISGQGGQDSMGALSPDFGVQVKQAYANLRAALDALGARPNQVAKLTVFVVDHDMSKLEVRPATSRKCSARRCRRRPWFPFPSWQSTPCCSRWRPSSCSTSGRRSCPVVRIEMVSAPLAAARSRSFRQFSCPRSPWHWRARERRDCQAHGRSRKPWCRRRARADRNAGNR